MEQLVVRLGSNQQDPVHWLVWSGQENEIIASGELADGTALNSLKERAGQRPITVLVPTSDIYLKWVTLPPKAGRKALAAIPYMLEDEITGDIQDQFFAMGGKQGDQQAVAIVNRQKMVDWQALIADAELNCNKMLPDVLALPANDESWSALPLGDQLLVRQDTWQGLQGHAGWIKPAIEHFAKQQTDPIQVLDFGESELSGLANIEVQSQPLDMPMQVLATGAANSSFNLLQGEFKPKRQTTNRLGKWRMAAILAGLALLMTLVDKGIQLSQLNAERADLQAQIQEEFKRAFPETTRIVNVRSQMRQKMNALEQGGGSVSVLSVMSQLADAFEATNVKPQTLRYDSARSELRIMAAASNFEALEQFKRLVESKGFEVQQGAINNRDDQVIGSLSIRS